MNNTLKEDLIKLKHSENEFLHLVESSSRDDLAKCSKFLAMYLALYRQKFGEIPDTDYGKLINAFELDKELVEILDDGMHEAAEMLKLILLQKCGPENARPSNMLLN